jgi:hypothetical protein
MFDADTAQNHDDGKQTQTSFAIWKCSSSRKILFQSYRVIGKLMFIQNWHGRKSEQ